MWAGELCEVFSCVRMIDVFGKARNHLKSSVLGFVLRYLPYVLLFLVLGRVPKTWFQPRLAYGSRGFGEPLIVPPCDPLERRDLEVDYVGPRVCMNELIFVEAINVLSQRIVVRVTNSAGRHSNFRARRASRCRLCSRIANRGPSGESA